MGFEYKGVIPAITEKDMNAIINIRKIASNKSSSETINMLRSSMEEVTTPSSGRFLRGFKNLAESAFSIKTKLFQEEEKKSLLKKSKRVRKS